jgi:translation elongation factor EF-Tu-like GTPase
MTGHHVIESRISYLKPVRSGYRGQFFYDGDDFDGFQAFPEVDAAAFVEPGCEVRAFIRFRAEMWEQVHQFKLHIGKRFEIREGTRVVGEGVVTRLMVSDGECEHLRF